MRIVEAADAKRSLAAEKREFSPKKLRIARASGVTDMVGSAARHAATRTALRRPAPARRRGLRPRANPRSSSLTRPHPDAGAEPDPVPAQRPAGAAGPLVHWFITARTWLLVRQIADDVIVMGERKLVEANSTDELLTTCPRDYTRELDRGPFPAATFSSTCEHLTHTSVGA